MKEIAVILPAYNEEATIENTLAAFFEELPDAFFVVVNNNSTDRTQEVAEQAFRRLGARGRVLCESRKGKGNAVRTALFSIIADVYVLCDADMTYPAGQVHKLLQPVLEETADIVVGDRRINGNYARENKRGFHQFGNDLVVGLVNRLFKAKLNDIMSGYRVISRRFARNYPILVEGFEIETDMTLYALDKRYRIVEVPVDYVDRPEGSESKLNTFRDGMKVLLVIFNIFRHYKPLVFFSWMAMLFLLFAIAFGVPVIGDWIQYRYIYHVPSAILASSLVLLSFLCFALGLILDSISFQERMRVEREMLGARHKLDRNG